VGDLFWHVSHGINTRMGTALMPAFETILSEQARWSAIDYVHALNPVRLREASAAGPIACGTVDRVVLCRHCRPFPLRPPRRRDPCDLARHRYRLSAVPPVNGIQVSQCGSREPIPSRSDPPGLRRSRRADERWPTQSWPGRPTAISSRPVSDRPRGCYVRVRKTDGTMDRTPGRSEPGRDDMAVADRPGLRRPSLRPPA